MRNVVAILLFAAFPLFTQGQVLPGAFAEAPPEVASAPAPAVDRGAIPEIARLDRVEERKSASLGLVRIGTVRALPAAVRIGPDALAKYSSPAQWAGRIRVDGAPALRVHFEAGSGHAARVWVGGRNEPLQSFVPGPHLSWGPTTNGDTVDIVIESNGASDLTIREVAQLLPIAAPAPDDTSCLADAVCFGESNFSGITNASRAVAHMRFVRNGGAYICTGALINNSKSDSIRYFLTASHCISTQAEASSLETVWDFRNPYCGAPSAEIGARRTGAQLLVASTASDVALLRLNSIPGGRYLLGWDARASSVGGGTVLYRLSHPEGLSQGFSVSSVVTTGGTCSSWPRPNFLYATPVSYNTSGGSSGSPVMLSGGYIVGQLTGACGPAPQQNCNVANRQVDGALSASWPLVSQYLSPPENPVCTPTSARMCLNGDRFAVSVNWRTSGGQTGIGTGVELTSDSGYFWFFGSNNIELMIKVLGPVDGKFWVFYGALSDVEYTITIQDVATGKSKTYFNPNGRFASVADFGAF